MLLLEGTFPYVAGGVSSWVDQIIRGFPLVEFGICFIGSRQADYGSPKYALPDNVVHFERHFIMEFPKPPKIKPKRGSADAFDKVRALHEALREQPRTASAPQLLTPLLQEMASMIGDGGSVDESAFLYSEQAWDYVANQYEASCTDPSFIDYFWTVRLMHAPIWTLNRIVESLIPSGCYHAISTGYAGFLGALLKNKTGRPLILSEHGIYTKERKIDLFQSTWIRDNRSMFEKDASDIPYFRDLWIRFFEALGRICYEASNTIVALYETNRIRQVNDGAAPERTQNIANGIDLPRMAKLRSLRPPTVPLVLCLIGRVVPIKDIKTFIRAMRTVVNSLPEAEGWIAGPEDEDPAYSLECRSIAASLGLKDKVKFMGFQKIDELMPRVGLIVLSSVSEALPLVILEGYAAGVPAVSTDVGACRQLVYGLDEQDQALGAAGIVVPIADPQALAHAAVALLSNSEHWHAAQAAGIARVERYYTHDIMFSKYRAVYVKAFREPTQAQHVHSFSREMKGCKGHGRDRI